MVIEEGREYQQIAIFNTEVDLKLLVDLSFFPIFLDHSPKFTFSRVLYDYNIYLSKYEFRLVI